MSYCIASYYELLRVLKSIQIYYLCLSLAPLLCPFSILFYLYIYIFFFPFILILSIYFLTLLPFGMSTFHTWHFYMSFL